MKNENLWTIQMVADYFAVTSKTIRNWVEAGVITPIKIGGTIRFKPEDVFKLAENSETRD